MRPGRSAPYQDGRHAGRKMRSCGSCSTPRRASPTSDCSGRATSASSVAWRAQVAGGRLLELETGIVLIGPADILTDSARRPRSPTAPTCPNTAWSRSTDRCPRATATSSRCRRRSSCPASPTGSGWPSRPRSSRPRCSTTSSACGSSTRSRSSRSSRCRPASCTSTSACSARRCRCSRSRSARSSRRRSTPTAASSSTSTSWRPCSSASAGSRRPPARPASRRAATPST